MAVAAVVMAEEVVEVVEARKALLGGLPGMKPEASRQFCQGFKPDSAFCVHGPN
jgi:hypothetical protein